MVVLAGGACAPLLLSGQADPGLVALAAATAASVGGNVLSEVLTDGVDQLRDHPDEMDAEQVQDWLEAQFTRVLEAGGQQATVLEAELALLLDEVGAGQAAVAEAVRLGHEETAHRMRAGLAEMDEHLAAVGSRLEDLHITADEILRDVRLLLDRASPPAPTPVAGPVGWLLREVTSPFSFDLEVHRAIDVGSEGPAELPVLSELPVVSKLVVASKVPSGLNATPKTALV